MTASRTFILVITLLLFHNINYAIDKIELQRKLFLTAEEELKKSKDLKKSKVILQKYADSLNNYPLLPYLQVQALQQGIAQVSTIQVQNFLSRYGSMPLAMPLKNAWLLNTAKQQRWQDFLTIYGTALNNPFSNEENPELQCYFIQADYKFNNTKLINLNEKIKKIWLSGDILPKSCDVVFSEWRKQNLMTKSMVWQRIKLAINNDNISLARFLANNYLIKEERPMVELWIKVHNNPWLIVKKNYFNNIKHQVISEILIHGVLKIAKTDSDKAIKIWQQLSSTHKFTERHFNYIVKAIAIYLVRESHPKAWDWLKKINYQYKDKEIYNAQLIVALKKTRWDWIIGIYNQELPEPLKNEEKWIYWYARALEMQHRSLEGKNLLIELANKRSYYGFLASSKLLKPYNFKFKAVDVNAKQIEAVFNNKAVRRAYELLQLDRINKASQEWCFALKNMAEWQLHAAAKLADNLNVPNWAITALSDAKQQDDLSLRFPKHYSLHIIQEAKKNQLDPAWVFAVTRQESAFKPYVKSYAGALGLMQLMPNTGYMVAKTLNLKIKNKYDILDINNNVKLGSKYLQLMLNKYKNVVVATAAYNAGPGRVGKWLPEYDIAADIWIETIPFRATRDYVQNVMTHTVIYQKLLGKNHYLDMPLIKKI